MDRAGQGFKEELGAAVQRELAAVDAALDERVGAVQAGGPKLVSEPIELRLVVRSGEGKAGEGLFRRAIIQSSPASLGLGSARSARKAADRFLDLLGTDPRAAPVADILDAQTALAREAAGRLGLRAIPSFRPVAGVGPLPDTARWSACLTDRARGLDVIIGTTGREMSAFYTLNPALRRLRRVPALGSATADAVEQAAGAALFGRSAHRLAAGLSEAGSRVWIYRFDYAAPASPFGTTHCVELPFLFGTDAD